MLIDKGDKYWDEKSTNYASESLDLTYNFMNHP